ncbi:hypothetical protein MTP99_014923 [Tenebrio molitor]|nr:hypothetical protein MTP99_014923 [Tenebrio molitor]
MLHWLTYLLEFIYCDRSIFFTDSSIRQSSNHQATTPFEIGGNFKPDENSVLIAAVPDTKTGINQTLTVPNPDFISRLEPPIIVYRLVLRIVQTLRFDHCGIGEETAVYLGLLTHFYNPIGTKAFIEQCELQARMTDMSILAPRPQLHWPFFRGLTSSPSRTGCYICWRSGMLP